MDEKALALALEEGEIAGATLDVFEKEPPLPTDYPLFGAPNCILSPHMAFASVEAMERRLEIAFENLYAFLEGRRVNVVC